MSGEIRVLEKQAQKLEGDIKELDKKRGLTEEDWKSRRNVKVKELVAVQRRLGGRCYLQEQPVWYGDVSNCIGFGFVAWMRACGHRLGADGRALKTGGTWLEINAEGRLWKKFKSLMEIAGDTEREWTAEIEGVNGRIPRGWKHQRW